MRIDNAVMEKCFVQPLSQRALVSVNGADALQLLQGILTSDVQALQPGAGGFSALLSPQGKVLFDFLILRTEDGFLFDLPKPQTADFIKRLTFYRLRAKANIAAVDPGIRIFAAWKARPKINDAIAMIEDPRLAALGWRIYTGGNVEGDAGDYNAHRIQLGVPDGGADYEYGAAFAHDAMLDQLGAIAFSKGCYVGQEVVSRVHHHNSARKRILQVEGEEPLMPGEVTAGDRTIGTLGSFTGKIGLALVRIDRAGDAITAGQTIDVAGMPVRLHLPPWANINWPAGQGGNNNELQDGQ